MKTQTKNLTLRGAKKLLIRCGCTFERCEVLPSLFGGDYTSYIYKHSIKGRITILPINNKFVVIRSYRGDYASDYLHTTTRKSLKKHLLKPENRWSGDYAG